MPTNMIGNFRFLFLHGDPQPPKEQVELVARGGVNGLGVFRTGVRGVPFEMVSFVDVPGVHAGRQEFYRYRSLIGQDPVTLIRDNYDFSREGWVAEVLDVQEAELRGVVRSIGGINPPSMAYLRCVWTLVAIQKATKKKS